MKANWVSTIPVISTAHILPETLKHLESMGGNAKYECGIFFFLGFDHPENWKECPDMVAVATWFRRVYGEDENWIRFDQDGDLIEELPDHSAAWEKA